jgi:histidine ammonia-lyase
VTVVVRGQGLTVDDVVDVAREGEPVEVAGEAVDAMAASRAVVDRLAASGTPVYGVSTGFGALATRFIEPDQRAQLQVSLLRSHAAGTGPPVEAEVVRAMVLLRCRSLALGCSGARPLLAQRLADLLNHGVTPVVPEHGSLGCSGDLAPLAHVALVLVGEGRAAGADGVVRDGASALAAAALAPVTLEAKEGLALINGTDGMLGMLALACVDLSALLRAADVTGALSVEALLGTDQAFDRDLVEARPHPGQAVSAANLRTLLAGSPIVASHREDDPRVQDAYSLRCAPQVHGAGRDALAFAESVVARELEAPVDNPLVLPDGRVASCGNFHGAPLAHAADFLAIVAADVASIAERRVDRLLDSARSHGLPPFLAVDAGVDSGLMIAQYTAAALVSDLKRTAAPASVDSIPSSAMQEDHVSMGWSAARKLRRSLDMLRRVLAIEYVVAAAGIDLRAPLEPGPGTGAAVRALRDAGVAAPGRDRWVEPDLETAERVLRDGTALAAVEERVGALA